MVKRENESDHRLIRYLISLPLDADVTNPGVLNEYSEVLKKINIDIKDSALGHIKLDIDDILSDGGGHFAMVKKLQSVLKKFNSDCKTKYKMSPSSVRSEGGEAAAGYCLNSVSYRVDEAVKYNVLNSD